MPRPVRAACVLHVDDPVRHPAEEPAVDLGQPLLAHHTGEAQLAVELADGPEFALDEPLGPLADTMANIPPRHDEIRSVLAASGDDEVGVRLGRVEVVGGDPVELRAEVPLHPGDEIARKSFQAREVGSVLWRHDDPELVPVAHAAFTEGVEIGLVARRVIDDRSLAIPARAVATDIAEVKALRACAPTCHLDDRHLDQNAPGEGLARSPADRAPGPGRGGMASRAADLSEEACHAPLAGR